MKRSCNTSNYSDRNDADPGQDHVKAPTTHFNEGEEEERSAPIDVGSDSGDLDPEKSRVIDPSTDSNEREGVDRSVSAGGRTDKVNCGRF